MAKGDVFHIDCANMTAIFDTAGLQDSTAYLPRVCFPKSLISDKIFALFVFFYN